MRFKGKFCKDLAGGGGERMWRGNGGPEEVFWESRGVLGEVRGVDAERLPEVSEGLVVGVARFLFEWYMGKGEVFTCG